jgi:hypothetical protein
MPISLPALADQVGGCTAALMPLFKPLEAYVLSAERLHGDDTRVPVERTGDRSNWKLGQRLHALSPRHGIWRADRGGIGASIAGWAMVPGTSRVFFGSLAIELKPLTKDL